MTSVGSFMRLWALFALLTVGYALADYSLHPGLRHEVGFSMEFDPSRVLELVHWGGRLYLNGAWLLLVCNVLFLSGMVALAASSVLALWRRRKRPEAMVSSRMPRPSEWPSC